MLLNYFFLHICINASQRMTTLPVISIALQIKLFIFQPHPPPVTNNPAGTLDLVMSQFFFILLHVNGKCNIYVGTIYNVNSTVGCGEGWRFPEKLILKAQKYILCYLYCIVYLPLMISPKMTTTTTLCWWLCKPATLES